ncbi:DNA-binding protein [Herminiimonas fonticola]|uniref:Plasmid replication DNA-binding protein KfrA n=1 Tax=Herminiimonas fonticola TaxID=303380 RepID=A0A4V3BUI7_9BURK|nr:DNA-binding protein [Herminiimonas fonticola]RBA23557.1 Plasmid replication region DNA-binding N-term [Herminiimonas fonticola]TDN87438.1 plasmid replication DNA-binding protein KfrA [Herminiimonas fonticola]
MARSGLYKSDVKKARDSLIAQGKNPSVDAVRIALGNTGSKTTIHKYMKELEEDGGSDGRQASISEALQDLVARLAAQLQDEADARIDALRLEYVEKERLQAEALAGLEKELDIARTQLKRTEGALQEEQAAHGHTREVLQRETVARHTADQQVADFKERLAENEAHRRSLEEKHQHAREALEHYRQSVKEQRDQDQRRHEQQVQQLQSEMRLLQQTLIVKQEDVTRINQEAARLVADLSHAQKALYDQQSHGRQLEQKLESLQAVEQRCQLLEAQFQEKDAHAEQLKVAAGEALKQAADTSARMHALELELATALAKLETQQTMAEELRAYMNRQDAPLANARVVP